jgi:hypothetical protein
VQAFPGEFEESLEDSSDILARPQSIGGALEALAVHWNHKTASKAIVGHLEKLAGEKASQTELEFYWPQVVHCLLLPLPMEGLAQVSKQCTMARRRVNHDIKITISFSLYSYPTSVLLSSDLSSACASSQCTWRCCSIGTSADSSLKKRHTH